MHGADITLEFPSVGATENILTAAVHAKGTTVIDNAAREPEIADLCAMLTSMGAEIEGAGSSTLVVHGVEPRLAARHRPRGRRRPDPGGDVPRRGCGVRRRGRAPRRTAEHMEMLLRRFDDMGVTVTSVGDGLAVWAQERLRSIDVATLPYPGIATDYKPLIVTMLSVADGVGIVTENLYPGRFRYVEELQRLGADIRTDGHHAVVRGVARLCGAPVRAPDIRAGAALGRRRAGRRGRDGRQRRAPHRPRLRRLVGRLVGIGADIERV